jgi:hypothetical protein
MSPQHHDDDEDDRMAKATLLYNALFSPASRRSIYWLRLYRLSESRHMGLLTEVPGNPGMSVINASSLLNRDVAQAFAIRERDLDIFVILPRLRRADGPIEAATYSQAPGSSRTEWRETSRRRIEALVGPLPQLPPHSGLFSAVLARGGRKHEWDREIFEAVPVSSLPPFHAPYQCAHSARFKSMLHDADDHSRDEALRAGQRFIASLTDRDRAICKYHQGDWAAIANASADIVARVDGRKPGAYLGAAEAVRLPKRDKMWLLSLFWDPLLLSQDRKEYTNGQHRGCALRFSGAEKAAVIVDFETIVDDHADWTYLGDG